MTVQLLTRLDAFVVTEDPSHPGHATCYQCGDQTNHWLQQGLRLQQLLIYVRHVVPLPSTSDAGKKFVVVAPLHFFSSTSTISRFCDGQ